VAKVLDQLREARCLTESHFQLADPVQTRQFITRMSVDRLRLMLIAMSQAESVAPAALARDKEKVDAQVLDEREGRDVVEDVAVENVSLEMEDLRRHKKSLMRKWRITGVQRRMVLMVPLSLLRLIST